MLRFFSEKVKLTELKNTYGAKGHIGKISNTKGCLTTYYLDNIPPNPQSSEAAKGWWQLKSISTLLKEDSKVSEKKKNI